MSMNKIIISGRLTADPEARATQGGTAMATFSVAVDRIARSGEEKQADFFDCVAFGKTAEFIVNYIHKGDGIELVGSMQMNHWNDKEGQKRVSWNLKVDSAGFPPSRKNASESPAPAAKAPEPMIPVDESDLPF